MRHMCNVCGSTYKRRDKLIRHQKYECGKEPQFQCPQCPHRSKRKDQLTTHIAVKHINYHNMF